MQENKSEIKGYLDGKEITILTGGEPKENEVWWVSYGSSPSLSKVKVIKITDKITITTGDIYHNISYNQVTHKRGYIEFVEKVE